MKELDNIINNLNVVISKANHADKSSVDNLIAYAELYEKQCAETIEMLNNSSDKLIKRINGYQTIPPPVFGLKYPSS